MVTPALVVTRYWSEIFEVCELQYISTRAFQIISIVGKRLAFVSLAVEKTRFVDHGALLRM